MTEREVIMDRLERLIKRLDDEGRYTDANICWLALQELKAVDAEEKK